MICFLPTILLFKEFLATLVSHGLHFFIRNLCGWVEAEEFEPHSSLIGSLFFLYSAFFPMFLRFGLKFLTKVFLKKRFKETICLFLSISLNVTPHIEV